MSYVKNYNPGQIRMDLPTANYIYELPLLSFGDVHGTLNLSLVFNYAMKAAGSNPFNIAAGYKLNLQKRLVLENGVPTQFQDESGKCTQLNAFETVYAFEDDTMRILRRTGSTYELENPDFSKEYYDQLGRITAVRDKYSNVVLEYKYSSGILDSITYRGTKEITFDYSNSNPIVITYGTHAISLEYSSANNTMMVTDPSGTVCALTASTNMGFDATVTAGGETATCPSKVGISMIGTSTLRISKYVGSHTVDEMTYVFPSTITAPTQRFNQVEITNHQGVSTRLQFKNDKPLYSYEIGDEDTMFVNGEFVGNVQIHSVFNNASEIYAAGEQTMYCGTKMSREDNSIAFCWKNATALDTAGGSNGLYLLSGWIKLSDSQYSSDTISLEISEDTSLPHIVFSLPKPPVGQWTYFTVGFPYSYDTMRAYIRRSCGNIETRDFRYTLQTAYAQEDTNTNDGYLAISENVLIHSDGSEKKYIPILGATFTCGDTVYSGADRVFYEDLLRYKTNQRKNRNTSEFYCNKGRSVTTYGPAVTITVTDADGETYVLNDCYLGKRWYTPNGIMTMRIRDDDTNAFLVYETLGTDGTTVLSAQTVDMYLDVVETSADGVVSEYSRENGLMTKETVVGLYERTIEYGTNGTEVIIVDEFEGKTKYTLDPTWGGVASVSIYNADEELWEPVYADEYDDDMCALMKRSFGTDAGRYNLLTYGGGNASSLQTGGLTYAFTYANGEVRAIRKNAALIEEHTHTAQTGSTYPNQTDSYYPSQSSKLHSTTAVYDKYGRLSSIPGVLTNTYDLWPFFDASTGALVSGVDNGSAVLAMTTDEMRGETSRFTYNSKGLLAGKTVTDEADFSDKISSETFEYDAIKRLTKHTAVYDVANSKSVESVIFYRKAETAPDADNTVSGCTYKVNGIQRLSTYNAFDDYNRFCRKETTITNFPFIKTLKYDETRVKCQSEMFQNNIIGANGFTYDPMGRIASDEYSVGGVSRDYKTYQYDQYGQLVRENNQELAKTFVYEYNDIGNLTSVKAYPYTLSTTPTGTPVTTAFGYTGDKLTSFGGTAIGYNTMGCPTTYDGKTATWSQGKLSRLVSGTRVTGTSSYSNAYNAYGQRVSRSYAYMAGTSGSNPVYAGQVTAYTKRYHYDHAGRLIAEATAKTVHGEGTVNENIVFLYDESGIIGMELTAGGASGLYYFHRNPLGDVVSIHNTAGTMVAKYRYDAWGNCTISGETTNHVVANANPIRYRGYYYDDDTGLYYCNARYYSPKWRRFISPDDTSYLDPESVNGLNQYCYCNNDPVNYADPSGYIPFLVVAAIAGTALGFGLAAYRDYKADGTWFNENIGNYIIPTLCAALSFAAIGASAGALLAGSFLASFGAIKTGALLAWNMTAAAGLGATGAMLFDNLKNAFHHSTHIFWSGGELPKNAGEYLANDLGGISLEMTRLGKYLSGLSNFNSDAWKIASSNFANQVQNGSTVFVFHSSAGIGINSIWGTVEFPILIKKILDLIYIIV